MMTGHSERHWQRDNALTSAVTRPSIEEGLILLLFQIF